jgi:hypothetical protein
MSTSAHASRCWHDRVSVSEGPTTWQRGWHCPDCGLSRVTFPTSEYVAAEARFQRLVSPTEAAQPAWFRLVWDIGQKVGCLASSFPDGNEHILRAIDRLVSVEPAQPAGESSGEPKPFTRAQLNRLWDNSPEHHGDATSRSAFERIVALVEAAHGIAAKQPGAESAACNSNEGRTE